MSLMPERQARSVRGDSRLKQRILHAGNLTLHGVDRGPNLAWSNFLGSQLAQLFDLKEVVKGITFRCRDQPRPLPSRELARSDAQNAKNFSSKISFHVSGRFASLGLLSRCRLVLTIRLLFTCIIGTAKPNIK